MAKRKPIKKIIHVNKSFIAMNAKDGGFRPVYTVKVGSKPALYARAITGLGNFHLPEYGKQLSCGARAWIETKGPIIVTDPMSFEQAKKAIKEPTGRLEQVAID